MGCFNYIGNFSRLPIERGDRIVMILGIRYDTYRPAIDGKEPEGKYVKYDHYAPGETFVPIALPIRGTYNDYGSIEKVDKTDAVKTICDFFDCDNIEEIARWFERIQGDCGHQLEKDVIERLKKADEKLLGMFMRSEPRHTFDFVMEHEKVFDKLVSYNDLAIADAENRYTEEFLSDIGCTFISEKDGERTYSHPNCTELMVHGGFAYVKKDGKKHSYIKTIRDLCKCLGIDVPVKYEANYIEYCIDVDKQILSILDSHLGGWEDREKCCDEIKALMLKEKQPYTMLRHIDAFMEHLFYKSLFLSHSGRYRIFLGIYPINTLVTDAPVKELRDFVALLDTITGMHLIWGESYSGGQDHRHEMIKGFLETCLEVENASCDEDD